MRVGGGCSYEARGECWVDKGEDLSLLLTLSSEMLSSQMNQSEGMEVNIWEPHNVYNTSVQPVNVRLSVVNHSRGS